MKKLTSINGGTCNHCGEKKIKIAGPGKLHNCLTEWYDKGWMDGYQNAWYRCCGVFIVLMMIIIYLMH